MLYEVITVAEVVAAEGQHREGIAPHHADFPDHRRRGLRNNFV